MLLFIMQLSNHDPAMVTLIYCFDCYTGSIAWSCSVFFIKFLLSGLFENVIYSYFLFANFWLTGITYPVFIFIHRSALVST